MKEWLGVLISFCIIVGMVVAAISYFASAKDLHFVQIQLDQKIVTDSILQTKQKMWQLEDRNKRSTNSEVWSDDRDKKDYRELQQDLEMLKKRYDKSLEKSK